MNATNRGTQREQLKDKEDVDIRHMIPQLSNHVTLLYTDLGATNWFAFWEACPHFLFRPTMYRYKLFNFNKDVSKIGSGVKCFMGEDIFVSGSHSEEQLRI